MTGHAKSKTKISADPAIAGPGPRLYQQAHDIIADQIVHGALAPGDRLTETRIAERFGISRAPARQALQQLEDDGLISKADGRGFYVREGVHAPGENKSAVSPEADAHQLRSSPSWERIYRDVESEIAQRTIAASWRVIEAELARYYGVSRTVARDVLGRLQQSGVVAKDDRSRWQAPALTATYVGELYELRAILEPEALAKAANHVPPAYLDQMQSNLVEALAKEQLTDWTLLDRLEDEMHVQLLSYCGSRAMQQAIRLHQSLLIAHRFLYRKTARMFQTEPFLAEHLSIVEHMKAGETSRAKDSLRAHLLGSGDRASARIEHLLEQYDPPPLPYLERTES